jgi:hypothetical protein
VLRRLSECSFRLHRRSFRPYSSLDRQLIPVSYPTTMPPEVTEEPASDTEYARLFNERFATIRKHASRPPSAGDAPADYEEEETTWLERALGGQGEDEVDQITPTKGGLTIQFGAR